MGCQREIVDLIIDKECDYVFSLKGSQGNIHQVMELSKHMNREGIKMAFFIEEKEDKGDGRIAMRKYTFLPTLDWD